MIGTLLIVAGLFLPWVSWEGVEGHHQAGSVFGLETLDGWVFLILGILGGSFSLKGKSGLSSGFIVFFGLLIFLGGILDFNNPIMFVPEKVTSLAQAREIISTGWGLYVELASGFLILSSGIFSLIQKWRIGREVTPLPPY
ncbi:hypothetical protein AKJ57_00270 [candidate division MSBL1 archaeon SCGC-AAA259A05]|uniref:Uncharacterized protein n=1 Tax=candidate division MSBL1 archaeon SCGC-AAA259A05 TaxID=1698259 RepID=A0A133UBV5_9EURY|nr:hypothetical protein AKJ57_00270 [candidate division MSBL1 archaeon SCGC-AAA259A05]